MTDAERIELLEAALQALRINLELSAKGRTAWSQWHSQVAISIIDAALKREDAQ